MLHSHPSHHSHRLCVRLEQESARATLFFARKHSCIADIHFLLAHTPISSFFRQRRRQRLATLDIYSVPKPLMDEDPMDLDIIHQRETADSRAPYILYDRY